MKHKDKLQRSIGSSLEGQSEVRQNINAFKKYVLFPAVILTPLLKSNLNELGQRFFSIIFNSI